MSAADRRTQLLDIARDIVAAEGFAAASIDRVARAAHVARALVYQQFDDLSGLMAALLERESEIALAGVSSIDVADIDAADIDAADTDDSPNRTTVPDDEVDRVGPDDAGNRAGAHADVDRVGAGILAYLHAAPTSWQIMLSPPDGGPPDLRERLELGRAYARTIGARHLSRYTGVTVDPDGPTERLMLVAIEELARLHLADPRTYPDEMVLRYLRSLVDWATGLESPHVRD
ncbi:TetR family transcriptional regulator [Nocardia sp. NPDC005366]|uniref:TetR family transcriptional regulator n=1 Tax=Nocardia sp. NPDC005366 TaxID=3156878 RepID=UPI0033B00AD7